MGDVASLRDRLFSEQKGRCHYCRTHMVAAGADDPRAATLDHRVPKAVGGPLNYLNAVCACRACNEAKADKPERDFLKANRLRKPKRRKARPLDADIAKRRAEAKMRARKGLGTPANPYPIQRR